jgi:putative molybdopterin biosynthesis protein
LFPGRRLALVSLAWRRLGLITPPGNPAGVTGLADLSRPELRFINRQPGSETRVWLDSALARHGIDQRSIRGYSDELLTHSAVAATVAEGHADVGFCLLTSAWPYGLEFIELVRERYELVIPEEAMELPAMRSLVQWLATGAAWDMLESLGGYDGRDSGVIRLLD